MFYIQLIIIKKKRQVNFYDFENTNWVLINKYIDNTNCKLKLICFGIYSWGHLVIFSYFLEHSITFYESNVFIIIDSRPTANYYNIIRARFKRKIKFIYIKDIWQVIDFDFWLNWRIYNTKIYYYLKNNLIVWVPKLRKSTA